MYVQCTCTHNFLFFSLFSPSSLSLPLSLALPDIIDFTAGPVDAVTGDNVTLQCYADGSPIQNVTWTFTNTSGSQLFNISYLIEDTTARTGAVSAMSFSPLYSESFLLNTYSIAPPDGGNSNETLYGQLRITGITSDLAGTYNCMLVNKFDSDSNSTRVNVQCKSILYIYNVIILSLLSIL